MKPTHYTLSPPKFTWETSPTYVFHYKFSDIRKWIKDKGGVIITKANDKIITSRGFWNLNGPCDVITTFNTQRCPEFFGGSEKFDPESIINPTPSFRAIDFHIMIPKGIYQDGKEPVLPRLRLKDFGLTSSIPEENE